MTPLATLVPNVRPTGQLFVYEVASRSRKRYHVVDLEARSGLGRCACEAHQFNKKDCHHLQEARKYLVCEVVQGAKEKQKGKSND